MGVGVSVGRGVSVGNGVSVGKSVFVGVSVGKSCRYTLDGGAEERNNTVTTRNDIIIFFIGFYPAYPNLEVPSPSPVPPIDIALISKPRCVILFV